jgi:two-component system response regulator AtoC
MLTDSLGQWFATIEAMDRIHREQNGALSGMQTLPPEEIIFGRSEAMELVRKRVCKVATTSVPLLIQGEGGTGKEVLARWIHERSAVSNGEFVKVNCAAIPRTLLESELFGYEKGAFTGANNSQAGRVELAHNGTLFLDEISDLDIDLQSKLLHFLQDGRFCPVGGLTEKTVNARLMCATHEDLAEQVNRGRFRADLFYRINVIQLNMPPLRERREDIPALAEYLRAKHMKQFERDCDSFRAEMIQFLQNMNWPGNMRELSNGIARYVLIGPDASVSQEPLQKNSHAASIRPVEPGVIPLKRITKEAIRQMEHKLVVEALKANRWNRRKTAQTLKISYRALIYKIREAGVMPRKP